MCAVLASRPGRPGWARRKRRPSAGIGQKIGVGEALPMICCHISINACSTKVAKQVLVQDFVLPVLGREAALVRPDFMVSHLRFVVRAQRSVQPSAAFLCLCCCRQGLPTSPPVGVSAATCCWFQSIAQCDRGQNETVCQHHAARSHTIYYCK